MNINEWVIISNFNLSKRDKSYFFVLLCILQLSSMSLWIPYISFINPLSNYIFILFIYKTPYIVLYLYFHQSITTIQSLLLPIKFTTMYYVYQWLYNYLIHYIFQYIFRINDPMYSNTYHKGCLLLPPVYSYDSK